MKQANRILYSLCISALCSTSHIFCSKVTAEISYGELIDKITILRIKSQKINNEEKLKNVRTELESLQETCAQYIDNCIALRDLEEELQQVNLALWNVEDAIRIKERDQEFDDEFIELARQVYTINDKRCTLKKKIDVLLGSHLTEEKSYK
jgi:hypothetical protein